MAHTDHHGSAHAEHVGHETSDASLGGVEKFMVIVAGLLGVCFVLVWFLQSYFVTREAAEDVKPSPMVPRAGDRVPPAPRLQTREPIDLAAFRQSEATELEGWEWVDKEKGIAHIPVSRAIDLIAEHGLPMPQPPAGAPAAPAPAAGAAPGAQAAGAAR